MKVVIAPDSFKEGLSAHKIGNIIYNAFKNVNGTNEYHLIPISDGGEGILNVLTNKTKEIIVTGPLGEPTNALIGFLDNGKTIVLEMAMAAGLEKVDISQRKPLNVTNFGVGELILKALDHNPEKIILGLGGSATNDIGIGALSALGLKFFDKKGKEVGIYGSDLFKVESIDSSNIDRRLLKCEFVLAIDVTNPLLGENGATYVYGPQKGLGQSELEVFDKQIEKVSDILNNHFKSDFTNVAGTGSCGGLPYALATVFNAKITPGFNHVYEYSKLEKHLKGADILITGEGRMDMQTLNGKAPFLIAQKAKEINPEIITIAVVGESSLVKQDVFNKIVEISDSKNSLKSNIKRTKENLYEKSVELAIELFHNNTK